AFAGIGDPEKFFATLADAGIALAATRGFADHHRYTRAEAMALCDVADCDGLVLVTTEKDRMRLSGEGELKPLADVDHAHPAPLVFEEEARFTSLLLERVAQARKTLAR